MTLHDRRFGFICEINPIYYEKQFSLLVISLTVFMVVFTNLTSIAQESSVRIDSDTLFINGDKVARYQIGEVKGKAVTIETFFFEKDGNQVYSNYLKLFEHRVRQDLQGRGLFKGYKFYFAYGFNEVISPEYVGIPESAEMDTSGTVSFSKNQLNEPRTPVSICQELEDPSMAHWQWG